MIEGVREAAAAPLDIGEDAVSPLRAQRPEALFEKAFVIHRRAIAWFRASSETRLDQPSAPP
jgi:hypothetical protein